MSEPYFLAKYFGVLVDQPLSFSFCPGETAPSVREVNVKAGSYFVNKLFSSCP